MLLLLQSVLCAKDAAPIVGVCCGGGATNGKVFRPNNGCRKIGMATPAAPSDPNNVDAAGKHSRPFSLRRSLESGCRC